jgi:glycosyltransferase involved in cell wall biosynthesis
LVSLSVVPPAPTPSASSIRLAICAAGEIWGGVERCIVTVGLGLRELGIDPLIVVFYDGPLAAAARGEGLDVVTLDESSKHDPRTIGRLQTLLRQRRINVLHVHGYRASIVGGLAARRLGIKVVKTEHGQLEPFPGWRAAGGHMKLAANVLLERIASRWLLDAQVFVSRDIQHRRGLRCSRVAQRLIYNGIDAPALPTVCLRRARSHQAFDVGIVGRIDRVKGHDVLLRAMTHLRHVRNLRLHVIGSGPLEEPSKRLTRQLSLDGVVQFHGFTAAVHERMASLDLLVMPSLHEGLPYVLLEAMSLRVPVIASRVGGLREVLDDGSGMLVPPGDPCALAAAIERLYGDRELRARLADRAHETVRRRFAARDMVRAYGDLYRQLLAPAS